MPELPPPPPPLSGSDSDDEQLPLLAPPPQPFKQPNRDASRTGTLQTAASTSFRAETWSPPPPPPGDSSDEDNDLLPPPPLPDPDNGMREGIRGAGEDSAVTTHRDRQAVNAGLWQQQQQQQQQLESGTGNLNKLSGQSLPAPPFLELQDGSGSGEDLSPPPALSGDGSDSGNAESPVLSSPSDGLLGSPSAAMDTQALANGAVHDFSSPPKTSDDGLEQRSTPSHRDGAKYSADATDLPRQQPLSPPEKLEQTTSSKPENETSSADVLEGVNDEDALVVSVSEDPEPNPWEVLAARRMTVRRQSGASGQPSISNAASLPLKRTGNESSVGHRNRAAPEPPQFKHLYSREHLQGLRLSILRKMAQKHDIKVRGQLSEALITELVKVKVIHVDAGDAGGSVGDKSAGTGGAPSERFVNETQAGAPHSMDHNAGDSRIENNRRAMNEKVDPNPNTPPKLAQQQTGTVQTRIVAPADSLNAAIARPTNVIARQPPLPATSKKKKKKKASKFDSSRAKILAAFGFSHSSPSDTTNGDQESADRLPEAQGITPETSASDARSSSLNSATTKYVECNSALLPKQPQKERRTSKWTPAIPVDGQTMAFVLPQRKKAKKRAPTSLVASALALLELESASSKSLRDVEVTDLERSEHEFLMKVWRLG